MPSRSLQHGALFALVATILIWTYSWVVMKQVLAYAGPFDFAALRYLLGAVVLFGALMLTRQSLRPPPLVLTARFGLCQTAGIPGAGAKGADRWGRRACFPAGLHHAVLGGSAGVVAAGRSADPAPLAGRGPGGDRAVEGNAAQLRSWAQLTLSPTLSRKERGGFVEPDQLKQMPFLTSKLGPNLAPFFESPVTGSPSNPHSTACVYRRTRPFS